MSLRLRLPVPCHARLSAPSLAHHAVPVAVALAVEEQASPALHGRPVAVLPYPEARTYVISANAAVRLQD